MNVKKNVIEDFLKANEFPMIDDNFDYLTRMPLYNLTFEKKEELINVCKEKQLTYDNIHNTSIKDLWENDIANFEKEYSKL